MNSEIAELKDKDTSKESSMESFNDMMEVYMDDYIVLDVPKIQYQLHHVANAIMIGIHDLFPHIKMIRKMPSHSRKF